MKLKFANAKQNAFECHMQIEIKTDKNTFSNFKLGGQDVGGGL